MNTNYGSIYSQLIDKYRNGLSYSKFAFAINDHLPGGFGFQAAHWHSIWRGAYKPNYYAMWYLSQCGTGWVRDFAADMLAALEGKA